VKGKNEEKQKKEGVGKKEILFTEKS